MRRSQRDAAAMKQHRAAPPARSLNGTAHAQKTLVPHEIKPTAIYFREDLAALGIHGPSIRREHRLGRLRLGRRCKRVYCLGEWLLAWYRAGEEVRGQRKADVTANGQAEQN